MNFYQKTGSGSDLNDSLKTFIIFERIIASVCILIPVILKLYDKSCSHFRYSISKYAYMTNSYIYGMLLCMAAMLFIFNGAIYFKSEVHLLLDKNGKWYNVGLGVSLIGVILFPPLKYHLIHLIFGTIFFIGNAFVIGFFQKKNRIVGITLAVLTVVAFILSLATCLFTLLWAEWISLATIGTHFFLEAKNAIISNTIDNGHQKVDNQT